MKLYFLEKCQLIIKPKGLIGLENYYFPILISLLIPSRIISYCWSYEVNYKRETGHLWNFRVTHKHNFVATRRVRDLPKRMASCQLLIQELMSTLKENCFSTPNTSDTKRGGFLPTPTNSPIVCGHQLGSHNLIQNPQVRSSVPEDHPPSPPHLPPPPPPPTSYANCKSRPPVLLTNQLQIRGSPP